MNGYLFLPQHYNVNIYYALPVRDVPNGFKNQEVISVSSAS